MTATNPGGHSSLPVPDNAIYHIADALTRREEDYYDVIRHGGSAHPPRRRFGIASAHDLVVFKVDIAASDLETDRTPRGRSRP